MKILRIPFDSFETLPQPGDSSVVPPSGDDAVAVERPATLPDLRISFSLERAALPGYGPLRPASKVEFAFPADDAPRVTAWFSGDFSRVTLPESETLKKNRRNAIGECLSRFYTSAQLEDLFVAPFRMAWRFRLSDGSFSEILGTSLLSPNPEGPYLLVTGYSLGDKYLSTNVEFTTFAARLMMEIPPLTDAGKYSSLIEGVQILMNRQAEFHEDKPYVTGLRTISVDGANYRSWVYDRYPGATVAAEAEADSDFRIIHEIPFAEVANGMGKAALPFRAGALRNFDSLPKPCKSSGSQGSAGSSGSSDQDPGKDPTKPSVFLRHFSLCSPPLDLNLPERSKQVRDLFLRGLFQETDLKLKLYGSHHRADWHLIAASSRRWIRGVCRSPFRWLRVEVEITLAPGEFLDVVTFRYD